MTFPRWFMGMVPFLAFFGSVFMATGEKGRAFFGALMLQFAFVALFTKVMNLDERINSLESEPRK